MEEGFTIEKNSITQVAAMHPRFAIALAEMNKQGWDQEPFYSLFMRPVAITAADVEWWFKDESDTAVRAYFEEFDKKSTALYNSGVPQLHYEIEIIDDAAGRVLILRVVSGKPASDPQYDLLTMTLTRNPYTQRWQSTQWQVQ